MRALLLALVLMMSTAYAGNPLVENEGKLTFSYMPFSYHWDRSHSYNEEHHGLGIGLGLGEGFTVGASRFRNSYGDMTTMASLDKYIGRTKEIHWSYGAGYAWGYKNNMVIPMAAWVSMRYKMIRLTTIPGVVTAFSIVIPIN